MFFKDIKENYEKKLTDDEKNFIRFHEINFKNIIQLSDSLYFKLHDGHYLSKFINPELFNIMFDFSNKNTIY